MKKTEMVRASQIRQAKAAMVFTGSSFWLDKKQNSGQPSRA
jgi:hypothetical protein